MPEQSNVFITQFGREIAKWPGYMQNHPRRNPDPGKYLEFNKQGPPADLRVGFHSFLYDYYTYALAMDFLESHDAAGPFERALDIGGREATVSKLLKAEKRAQWTSCVEILDFSRMLPEDLFIKFFMQLKGFMALRKNIPPLDWQLLRTHVENFGYIPGPNSLFWNFELRDQPVFDEYFVEDVYGLKGGYDLITAFLCLDYFDPRELFPKVFELLGSGGVFFFVYRYWWFPVNATLIVGEFPYACQRLTLEDLIRYFSQALPGKETHVETVYNYFHKGKMQPVMDDLIEIGSEYGLRLVGAKKLGPRFMSHPSTPYPPVLLQQDHSRVFNDVLEDIHCFRSDVRLSDLQTAYVMVAFEKP